MLSAPWSRSRMVHLLSSVIFPIVALMDVAMAVNPACDCVVFQSDGASQGRFMSPNFPNIYPRNSNCILYTFIGDLNEIIELTFLEFDLKMPTKGRCGDFVRLFLDLERPEVNEHSQWNAELCGNVSMIQKKHFSGGRSLVMEFHSDIEEAHKTGFRGIFRFLDEKQFITDGVREIGTQCTYVFESNNNTKTGKFFSPRYPRDYPPGSSCQYLFRALAGERVQLTFQNIQLHHPDTSCRNSPDAIVVHDGSSMTAPVIGTYCDVHNQIELLSSGNHLYVVFYSDDVNESQGFAATYRFIRLRQLMPITSPTISRITGDSLSNSETYYNVGTGCNFELSSAVAKNGTFTSPLYPRPYPGEVTCRYTFTGQGSERIQITFLHMDLYYPRGDASNPHNCGDSDSVTVSIIVNGAAEKIGTYCGSRLPPMLMSNEPKITVIFQSVQSSATVTGFKANYRFVRDFGISTGEQDPQYLCGFNYYSKRASSGVFISPNFPGLYPRSTECHYLFYGRRNERVHIKFNHFDVDGYLPRCEEKDKSDYVEFSNFYTEDTKMRRLCGVESNIERDAIVSDGEFFRVIFKSNGEFDASGFEASYTFIKSEEPYEGLVHGSASHTGAAIWLLVIIVILISS